MMYMTPASAPVAVPGGAEDRRRGAGRLGDPRLLPRHPADARARLGRRLDRHDL